MSTSDGSTADYYELPAGATELQDLISHRNLNAQDGEIFRAIYRKGRASHSDELRDARKVLFYAQAEVKRLEALSSSPGKFGQQNMLDTSSISGAGRDFEPASAIDDDSERMQAIGQNGEMASEVYAAVDGAPSWKCAPEWANWLAQDEDGRWQWYSLKPTLDDEPTEFSPQLNDQWWLADSDECTISADARSGWRSSLQPRPIK